MSEFDQFDKIVEGFRSIVKKIGDSDYKNNKEIQEELSLLKQFSEQQIFIVGIIHQVLGLMTLTPK